ARPPHTPPRPPKILVWAPHAPPPAPLAVRDSKNVVHPHLAFSAGAWSRFVSALDGRAPVS
ncbi:DUF397 domain-containing protein, partial [Streptomyces sp. NPDC059134]|uniref:DUF397 domain-containing protein n=1 Tax=Streptomyces sp. NPDC059134 TaxID=3346738 RepID=UPI00369B1591